MKTITVDQFGKDHWSLFAYIETRCVDYKGTLNQNHLRNKHPMGGKWNPEWGTRLKGYFKDDDTKDKSKLLKKHDDHDCLDDLEKAGLIKDDGTMVNPYAQLTKQGVVVASLLREHKSSGGMYYNFELKA